MLQRVHLCAKLVAAIKHETFGKHSLEFTLYTLALVAAAFRKMLQTRVTLANFSPALLNIIKILTFVIFLPLNIDQLVDQSWLFLTLTSVPLIYLFG